MQKVDLTGKKFSMLSVIKEVPPLNGKKRYECLCDCGNTIEVSYANLKGGKNKMSCGCMRKQWLSESQIKHGMRYTKLYRTWQSLRSRSVNSKIFKKTKNHITYFEKNIKVCTEWENSFESFMEWAKKAEYDEEAAKEGKLSIDRIDNDGDYEPSNCQWITIGENSRKDWVGKSNSKCRKLSNNDVDKIKELLLTKNHTQKEIAEMFGVERTTISRIKRGILNYV